MKKYIITISREFGCNAREISRMTATKLNIELHDKDMVDMAADRAGISVDDFTDGDRIVDKNTKKVFNLFSYGSSTKFYSERAVMAQAEIIRELANQPGSALFFGRCSDYILRSYPNRLNVFLYAPKEFRIKHMAEAYNMTETEAVKLINRIDRQRHNYYKFVTGKNRGDREMKQLMIDVSEFGSEGATDMICHAVGLLFS